MFFSIVIPLYNRPDEIGELLHSLQDQTYKDFEVVIVEDGSSLDAKHIVDMYRQSINIQYFVKVNEGQGFARNFGFERAKGDFFIVFDSDVIVPDGYLEIVKEDIEKNAWDAFGGADAAHPSFTATQKAISYSMTSVLTTGGIRGNKVHVGKFHPRSFNMGISRAVWEQTGGFQLSRRSEDIEFSIRMINQGFRVGLIPHAIVYHKRRTDFKQFFRQAYNFGKGRIDVAQIYPDEIKLVHLLPSAFTLALGLLLIFNLLNTVFFDDVGILQFISTVGNILLLAYIVALFLHSFLVTKNIRIAGLAVVASFTQLIAYGCGLMRNYLDRILLHRIG